MIESVFIVLGFLVFTRLLFDKWNIWNKLSIQGSKSNHKWIFKLFNCNFCLTFWVSVLLTFLYGCMNNFEMNLLLTPFTVVGLYYLTYQR